MSEDEAYPEDLPSKSQRKRDAHAQQVLGEQLTKAPASVLDRLPISDRLRAALDEFNRLPNSHGARRRQLQFIGKLIRGCDTDLIENILSGQPRSAISTQETEDDSSVAQRWCDRILQEGDSAINTVLAEQPNLERQKLRQLTRNYAQCSPEKRTRTRAKLLEYLRDFI